MTKEDAIISINEKFRGCNYLKKEAVLDFLCQRGYDPITIEETIAYFGKKQRFENLAENKTDEKEEQIMLSIQQEIQVVTDMVRNLVSYYNGKRKETIDMIDLEDAKIIFNKYCNKLKALDKTIGAANSFMSIFQEFYCAQNSNQKNEKQTLTLQNATEVKDSKPKATKIFKENGDESVNDTKLGNKTILESNPRFIEELSLNEDFTNRSPRTFIFENMPIKCRVWKDVYISAIRAFYDRFGKEFRDFLLLKEMNTNKLNYSGTQQRMQNSYYYEGANLYIETNINPNEIRDIIIKIVKFFHIDIASIQIEVCTKVSNY